MCAGVNDDPSRDSSNNPYFLLSVSLTTSGEKSPYYNDARTERGDLSVSVGLPADQHWTPWEKVRAGTASHAHLCFVFKTLMCSPLKNIIRSAVSFPCMVTLNL